MEALKKGMMIGAEKFNWRLANEITKYYFYFS